MISIKQGIEASIKKYQRLLAALPKMDRVVDYDLESYDAVQAIARHYGMKLVLHSCFLCTASQHIANIVLNETGNTVDKCTVCPIKHARRSRLAPCSSEYIRLPTASKDDTTEPMVNPNRYLQALSIAWPSFSHVQKREVEHALKEVILILEHLLYCETDGAQGKLLTDN